MEKITDLEFALLELKEEQLEKYEIGNKIEILFKHLPMIIDSQIVHWL